MKNPIANNPQSPLPDSRTKSRSRLKVAVFTVLAINVIPLTLALLMQGCKREQPAEDQNQTTTETNPPAMAVDTNPPSAMTNVTSQPVVTEPTPPPAPPAPTTSEYVIMKGDSFYSIGKKLGVSIKAISEANPGVDSTKLKIGQKLTIPAAAATSAAVGAATTAAADMSSGENIYTVKSGDTLTKIAKENNTTYKAIKAANNLTTDKIKVGQKLKIPAPATPAAPTPAAVAEPAAAAPAASNPAPAAAPASTPAPATTPAPAGGQ